MKNPKMFDLVVPKTASNEWTIGQIVGMSRFDLSIGPLLKVRDLVTGTIVNELPRNLDRMIRESEAK
jgi:hypothetical protein